ncbi:LysR family transcriptional regulator [Oceanospirillum sediminis]|uniref:LysR family transcriptional regulator n=1 Tax=Oceanospirillum sediminis TaxID=2760088 RepID=A0A839IQB7_9GAMM|nr:LysR family transcriptional regulator [Oceanospirillum sediminis]MBB1486679.1 LysR family transcriptional regulator [Oceanospirillum sediminis]
MIDELRAMAIFVHTVDTGSFRGAGRILSLSPSVVSHHINQLEQKLDTPLLYRSTRKLSLTDAGKQLYIAASEMLRVASDGLEQVNQQSQSLTGRLHITLPAMFACSPLMDCLSMFIRQHPEIELQMSFSDRAADLVAEGIDLAIRIGPLKDSALKARALFEMPRVLVCHPDLLPEGLNTQCSDVVVESPPEADPQPLITLLEKLPWIGFSQRPGVKTLIRKTRPASEQVTEQAAEAKETSEVINTTACINHFSIKVTSRISVDNLEAQLSLARKGLGLITPPRFMVQDDIAQGTLVDLLAHWQPEPLMVYCVWPEQTVRNHLTGHVVCYLQQHLVV